MRLKGYRVDHRLLRTGSANFRRSGETRQGNDLVALRAANLSAPGLTPSSMGLGLGAKEGLRPRKAKLRKKRMLVKRQLTQRREAQSLYRLRVSSFGG